MKVDEFVESVKRGKIHSNDLETSIRIIERQREALNQIATGKCPSNVKLEKEVMRQIAREALDREV
jgi:hypothetical protein